MPRRDGTGPMGMGPRTGRGMGFCNVARVVVSVVGGLGLSLGLGRRRGSRRRSFNNKMIPRNRKKLNTFHNNK